jgi:hypothetical protein
MMLPKPLTTRLLGASMPQLAEPAEAGEGS